MYGGFLQAWKILKFVEAFEIPVISIILQNFFHINGKYLEFH